MRDSWRSGDRPKLRADLIVEPASGGQSVGVVVRTPGSMSRCTLDDAELGMARLMDGERTVQELLAEAQRLGIPTDVGRLEELIHQLAENHLLENAEAAAVGASTEVRSVEGTALGGESQPLQVRELAHDWASAIDSALPLSPASPKAAGSPSPSDLVQEGKGDGSAEPASAGDSSAERSNVSGGPPLGKDSAESSGRRALSLELPRIPTMPESNLALAPLGDEAAPPSARRRALSASMGPPVALGEDVPASRDPGERLFEMTRAMTEPTMLAATPAPAPHLGDEAPPPSGRRRAFPVEMPQVAPEAKEQPTAESGAKARPAFPAGIEPVTDPISIAASPPAVDSSPAGAPTTLEMPTVAPADETTAPSTGSLGLPSAARDPTGSDEAHAMLQTGLTLMKRGWLDEAERTFGQIIEKHPQYQGAQVLLEMVRERQARGTPSEIPAFEPPPKPPLTTLEALKAIRPAALWKDRRVVAFAAGLMLLFLIPIGGAVITVPAELSQPAVLEPASRAQVSSPADRVVASIAVEPGAKVAANQLLATLEMLTAAADRERLSAEVERLEAELAVLERGASSAELAKARAEAAARTRALKGVMQKLARIKNQNDPALLELEVERKAALGAAREAEGRLKLLLQARKKDAVSRKQMELEAARLHKAALDRRADAVQLLSPVAGRVTTALSKSKVGAEVRQGELLFEVVDTSRMLARLELAEEAFEVRPGAAASFSDGSTSAQGRVTRVELVEDKAVVHIELDNDSGALKAGAKGQLRISLGRRSLWAAAFGD